MTEILQREVPHIGLEGLCDVQHYRIYKIAPCHSRPSQKEKAVKQKLQMPQEERALVDHVLRSSQRFPSACEASTSPSCCCPTQAVDSLTLKHRAACAYPARLVNSFLIVTQA